MLPMHVSNCTSFFKGFALLKGHGNETDLSIFGIHLLGIGPLQVPCTTVWLRIRGDIGYRKLISTPCFYEPGVATKH